MRTTVELPPDLMRRAKARAAEKGESLKSLFKRAVVAELAKPGYLLERPGKVQLPVFGDPKGKSVQISNLAIARILAKDDITTTRQKVRSRQK